MVEKTQRGRARKPASKEPAKTVKITIAAKADVIRRFEMHASSQHISKGKLFTDLVVNNCPRYVIHDSDKHLATEAAEPAGSPQAAPHKADDPQTSDDPQTPSDDQAGPEERTTGMHRMIRRTA